MKWFPVRVTFLDGSNVIDSWEDAIQGVDFEDARRNAVDNWQGDAVAVEMLRTSSLTVQL